MIIKNQWFSGLPAEYAYHLFRQVLNFISLMSKKR